MSFVGSYIDERVVKQLETRSKVFSKTNKTPDDIYFVNSKAAWVRLISGVNIGDNDKPAREFILSNLTSLDNTGKLSLKQSLNFSGDDRTKAYNFSKDFGVRPAPGITGFSIASKNRFGTIREATISFVVWSLEDFNIIENLYLRPGFQAVVEWGHTIYMDGDERISTSPPQKVNDIFKAKNLREVAKILEANRKSTEYNYDGFIGFTKNFSWSFRKDGGYDCTVNIISAGEVLESLSMSFSKVDKKQTEEDTKVLDTEIGAFLDLLGKVDVSKVPTVLLGNLYDVGKDSDSKEFYNSLLGKLKKIGYKKETPLAIGVLAEGSENGKEFWIPFGLLLDLVNIFNMPYLDDCNENQSFVEFDSINPQKFYTFIKHHSLDPLTCLLVSEDKYTLTDQRYKNALENILLKFYNTRIPLPSPTLLEDDNICNLLVNTEVIKQTLGRISEGEKVTVLSFIEEILGQIQAALGEVNEFDIDYNEQTFKFSVVDRNKILSSKDNIGNSKPPELKLTGVDSIFSEISIQSKISSALSSQIAISAQAASPDPTNSIKSVMDWNIGLSNRYILNSVIGAPSCDQTTEKVEETNPIKVAIQKSTFWRSTLKLITGVDLFTTLYKRWRKASEDNKRRQQSFEFLRDKAFNAFNKTPNTTYPSYVSDTSYNPWEGDVNGDRERFKTLKLKGKDEFGRQSGIALFDSNETEDRTLKTAQGIIPVELSFTTEGIGGFKIGQSYKVTNRILPEKYNNLGFIITGLDHKIQNQKWLTTVKSQTYIFPDSAVISAVISGDPEIKTIKQIIDGALGIIPTPEQEIQIPLLPSVEQPIPEDSSTQEQPPTSEPPITEEREFWTLVSICAREDNNSQAHADVAQSIYNRVKVGPTFYKSTILQQILGKGAYEPTWKFPYYGIDTLPNKEWKEIKDLQTATTATGLTRFKLLEVANALKNTYFQQSARDFIQGRTDFLGAREPARAMTENGSKVQRNRNSNQFGFSYNYKPSPIPPAADIPDFVRNIQLPTV